jgi:hypothetical protein
MVRMDARRLDERLRVQVGFGFGVEDPICTSHPKGKRMRVGTFYAEGTMVRLGPFYSDRRSGSEGKKLPSSDRSAAPARTNRIAQ